MRISILAVILGTACVSGCNFFQKESVAIILTDVKAKEFDTGLANTCVIQGRVQNDSKYRLESASFRIGTFRGEVGDLYANTYVNSVDLIVVSLDMQDATCAYQAQYVNANLASFSVLGCTMPGIPEGQCQKMVRIKSIISNADIDKLAAFEQGQRDLALAPLRNALDAVANPDDDNQIMDVIVSLDALSWEINQYDSGSINGTSVIEQTDDESAVTVKSYYTFNNGTRGWVKATLFANRNILPCLECWDFRGECRPLRLPHKRRE